ncbi:MAG: hypothetical protein D6814_15175 [Calditrichaeota bacterium]|nr:MAG: hypothetical protein D6814_15175 [Calditrichota bacterium]
MIFTAFLLSICLGAAGTAIIWLVAPLLSGNSEELSVLRQLSWIFLFSNIGAISGALLQRQGDFKRFSFIEVVSYFLGYSGIALYLAITGHGVFSLVYGALAQTVLRSFLLIVVAPPPLKFLLEKSAAKPLIRFGGGLTFARIFNYAAFHVDYFVTKISLGAEALGLYSRAFYLMRLPTDMVMNSVHTVLFPTFSQMQGENHRLAVGYFKAFSLSALLIAPVMVTIALTAPEGVIILFGEPWRQTILPLQILCPVGILNLYSIGDALLKATGHIKQQMFGHLFFALCITFGTLIGASFGIRGIAIAVLAANTLMFIYMVQRSLAVLGKSWRALAKASFPAALAALIVLSIGLAARETGTHFHFTNFSMFGFVLVICLIGTMLCFSLPISEFRELRYLSGMLFMKATGRQKATKHQVVNEQV